MKNFTFIACLCFVTAVYAGNDKRLSDDDFNQTKLNAKIHEADVKSIEIGNNYVFAKDKKLQDLQTKPSEYAFLSKKILSETDLRQMVEMVWKEQLDSIVCAENSTGQKISRQYFKYDEKGNPMKRINSYWNPKTNSWDDAEISEFICDEDGYVISQRAYNAEGTAGQRYDYEYDDRKWGIVMISFTLKQGEWVPNMKGEYVYDDSGNIIQETQFAYDPKSSSSLWIPVIRNKGAWDEYGRQLLYEPYEWDGNNWIGNAVAEKKEYEWDKNGNSTLIISSIWDPEANDWFAYCRREQDFLNSDSQHCTRQEKKFFNKALNNWGGAGEINGYVYHNTKSIIEYDEQGREIHNASYTGHTNNEYTIGAESFTVWTASLSPRTTGTQSVRTSTLYPEGREPYVNDITTERFDAQGNKIYLFEKHIDPTFTELQNYLEYDWVYDNQQREIAFITYNFDKNDNSKKLGVSKQLTVYDEHGNIVEYISQKGQNTGAEDWTNGNYFTYAYDQDSILVEKKAYFWNGVEYFPNWGNGCTYDYSIPISEVNMWPGANTYHKISETQSYTGVDGEWDYTSFKYYYSNISTGLKNRTINESIKVYPKYVDEQLNVIANEDVRVNIYNIQGVLVLTTVDKNINVSNLPYGIYIVEVNKYKTKIVKK